MIKKMCLSIKNDVLVAGGAIKSNIPFFVVLFAYFMLFAVDSALSYTSPGAGDLGFQFYDIVINKILFGAIGTTFGVGAMAYAAIKSLSLDVPKVVGGLVGGGMLLESENLANSFGINF